MIILMDLDKNNSTNHVIKSKLISVMVIINTTKMYSVIEADKNYPISIVFRTYAIYNFIIIYNDLKNLAHHHSELNDEVHYTTPTIQQNESPDFFINIVHCPVCRLSDRLYYY